MKNIYMENFIYQLDELTNLLYAIGVTNDRMPAAQATVLHSMTLYGDYDWNGAFRNDFIEVLKQCTPIEELPKLLNMDTWDLYNLTKKYCKNGKFSYTIAINKVIPIIMGYLILPN